MIIKFRCKRVLAQDKKSLTTTWHALQRLSIGLSFMDAVAIVVPSAAIYVIDMRNPPGYLTHSTPATDSSSNTFM